MLSLLSPFTEEPGASVLKQGETNRGRKAVCEASYTRADDCRAGNTGMFSCFCVSYLGEIATDPTS